MLQPHQAKVAGDVRSRSRTSQQVSKSWELTASPLHSQTSGSVILGLDGISRVAILGDGDRICKAMHRRIAELRSRLKDGEARVCPKEEACRSAAWSIGARVVGVGTVRSGVCGG